MGIIVLGITCFIDDIKGLPPLTKLAGQIIAAIIVVYSGIRIDNLNLPFFNEVGLNYTVSIIITLGWIVGITNAINLIDGLDRIIFWNRSNIMLITTYNILTKLFTSNSNTSCNSTSWSANRFSTI